MRRHPHGHRDPRGAVRLARPVHLRPRTCSCLRRPRRHARDRRIRVTSRASPRTRASRANTSSTDVRHAQASTHRERARRDGRRPARARTNLGVGRRGARRRLTRAGAPRRDARGAVVHDVRTHPWTSQVAARRIEASPCAAPAARRRCGTRRCRRRRSTSAMRAVASGSTGSTVRCKRSPSRPRQRASIAARPRRRSAREAAAPARAPGACARSAPSCVASATHRTASSSRAWELFRCPDCAGSFVPRSSAHLLLDRVREPRAVTLWGAFVGLMKRLVGVGAS